jgi:hypothetical protein
MSGRTLPMTRRQADARNNQLLMADESQRNRAELFEIEGQLQDERLKEDDRHALHGAQQVSMPIQKSPNVPK